MNNQKQNATCPELRFPEFENDGGWEEKPLGELATLVSERASETKYTLMSVTAGIGLVTQLEKFGREIAGQSYKNYYVIKEGDIAYNKSATKQHPQGQMAVLENIEQAAVPNSIFTCFRLNIKYISPYFLKYPFANNLHGKWLQKYITIGARANGALSVDTKDLLMLPVAFPPLQEQQKIADCLSSLDGVIAAAASKLAHLKTHKKGLMQQLFPAEGKTTPKYRFPEFKNDGEWEEKRLSEFGYLRTGLTYTPENIAKEGILVLRSSNIQNGKISLKDTVYVSPDTKGINITKPNDILICVRNGSKSLIGKNAIIPENMPSSTHGAFMTIFRSDNPNFIFQIFQTEAYKKQVASDLGATINSINGKQFLRYRFYLPKLKEQQKIADCLSSLDSLIQAEEEKLERLKSFKKGLLQQLFPAPEDSYEDSFKGEENE